MIHINEEREDRWVAALCHASMGLMMIGVLVPLVVWITQKERSAFLRFQALQALVYQALGFLLYFILNACMIAGIFGLFGFSVLGGILTSSGESADPTNATLAMFVMFFVMGVMVVFMGGMFLGAPLYLLVAVWGAFRVMGGHNFRYPVLGRFIQARLDSPAASAPPTPA